MYRNPDPKPGCWVLPVVVIGMIAFTWFFIQRLEPDEIDPDAPSSSITSATTSVDGAPDNTTPTPTDQVDDTTVTTATTLVAPEVQIYLDNLTEDKETLSELVTSMDTANSDWENRESTGVTYADTEEIMEGLAAQALVFSQTVELRVPPPAVPGLIDAHEFVLAAAQEISIAAEEILQGLRAPDTGELRRSALLKFRSEAEGFNLAVDDITNIIRQGSSG